MPPTDFTKFLDPFRKVGGSRITFPTQRRQNPNLDVPIMPPIPTFRTGQFDTTSPGFQRLKSAVSGLSISPPSQGGRLNVPTTPPAQKQTQVAATDGAVNQQNVRTFTTPSGARVTAGGTLVSGPTTQVPPLPQVQQPLAPTVQAPSAPAPTPVVPPTPTFEPRPVDPQLAALRAQVLQSFQPTAQETELQERLGEITTGTERGIEEVRRQPIARRFLTGQAAGLLRQQELESAPLARRLALLQQQRQAQREGAEAALGFRTEDIEREQEQQQAFQDQQVESAVSQLVGQGVTDPAQIAASLPNIPTEAISRVFDNLGIEKPVEFSQFELQKQQLELQKLQAQIDAATDPLDRQIKQAQLDKLRAQILSTQADLAAGTGEDQSPFLQQMGGIAQNKITQLRAKIGDSTVGSISAIAQSRIPGTTAFDFRSNLETLKANIGFGILQQMREASKTGGALGQVSERELGFLQDTLGSLNQGQSPESFRQNLLEIEESINRWIGVMQGQPQGQTPVVAGTLEAALPGQSGVTASGVGYVIEE